MRDAERLRFSGPERRPPTSAMHLRRAGTPCVRLVLARVSVGTEAPSVQSGAARRRVAPRCRVVRSPKQPAARHAMLRRDPTDAIPFEKTPDDEPRELLAQQSPRVPRGPSKGLALRAPLLVAPLEHPSYRLAASKGLEAPSAATTGRRPASDAVPRRPALSVGSGCFPPNRNPSTP